MDMFIKFIIDVFKLTTINIMKQNSRKIFRFKRNDIKLLIFL